MKNIIIAAVMLAAIAVPATVQAYNYPGFKWGVTTVGWETAGLNVSAWRTAATDAMNGWNNAGARYVMVNYAGSKNTMSYFWESSRTLAYTNRYREYGYWGNIYRATIKVNTYQRWNPPYATGTWYDLRSVIRHELGHTVPLDHVYDRMALMYPETSAWTVTQLSADERNGIRAIYGVR